MHTTTPLNMQMPAVKCLFIVIAYGQPEITETCLRRLQAHLPEDCEVVLYDNASPERLESLADRLDVHYIRSQENLGFAGGADTVLQWCFDHWPAETYCLLNSDVYIDQDFGVRLPEQLAIFHRSNRIGAMQPLLYLDEKYEHLENAGILYFWSGLARQQRKSFITQQVFLNGACLFLKRSTLQYLRSKQEPFFMAPFFFNAEDLELSYRLLRHGYQLWVNDQLRAQHLGSQSSQSISTTSLKLSWRNLLYVIGLHWSRTQILRNILELICGQLFLMVYAGWKTGNWRLAKEVYTDVWNQRFWLVSWRRRLAQKAPYLSGRRQWLF